MSYDVTPNIFLNPKIVIDTTTVQPAKILFRLRKKTWSVGTRLQESRSGFQTTITHTDCAYMKQESSKKLRIKSLLLNDHRVVLSVDMEDKRTKWHYWSFLQRHDITTVETVIATLFLL